MSSVAVDGERLLMERTSCVPFIPGITTSEMTSWIGCGACSKALRAASAFSAVNTLYPDRFRIAAVTRSRSGSSSATRMVTCSRSKPVVKSTPPFPCSRLASSAAPGQTTACRWRNQEPAQHHQLRRYQCSAIRRSRLSFLFFWVAPHSTRHATACKNLISEPSRVHCLFRWGASSRLREYGVST